MKPLVFTCFLLLYITAAAQPRFTDSTFGTNGKVVENTSVSYTNIIDALLQTDGKTLTLAISEYNGVARTVLIRYNTNGTADASFSSDGVADSLITPGIVCNPEAMRLQTDGKILVGGNTGDYYNKQAFVMRYNVNGSLDASFGASGILYLPSFMLSNTLYTLPGIESLTVLSTGKIMLLSTPSYPSTDFALVRINPSGTVDNSFGTNGIVAINPPGLVSGYETPTYTHLQIQTDGKYIVGGYINYYGYILARVNTNGTLDNSYGTNGSVKLSGGPTGDGLEDMLIQPDNKVVLSGGENYYGLRTYTCVMRVTTAGTLDAAAFGTGGKQVFYTAATGFGATVSQLSLQTDGKILVGGMAKNEAGNYTIAVMRLTTTGTLDATFDSDGIALLQVNGYNSFGNIPLQQADGKIVIAGYVRSNNIRSPTIGCFTAAGQTDATLNAVASITLLNNGTDYEDAMNVLVQPADQKIVSIGERGNGYGGDFCVRRYQPNGQPDPDFGTNGKFFFDIPGYNYQYYSGISADGKITIIPDFADFVTGGTLAAFRLKANGQPDSSFGHNGRRIFKSRNTDTIGNFLGCAAVQPDGKILLAFGQNEGPSQIYVYPGRDSSFLIRLNNDGSFDNSFNGTGKIYLSTYNSGTRIAVQPDGKIVLSHTVNAANNTYQSVVRRLNVDGSTDPTFNNGVATPVNNYSSQITLQPDGKILLTGFRNTVTRLLSNGSYDSTFGINGTVDATNYYPSDNGYYITNIKATNSRVTLMGNFYDTTLAESVIKLVALKNNGFTDSTFGESGVVFPEILTHTYSYEGLRMALQADGKAVVTGYTVSSNNPDLSDFAATRLKSGPLATGRLYTFTGSGLWSNPVNWSNGMVPPTTIPTGSSVVIDPPASGECVIDITVHVQTGATVTVKAGKKVRLPGNLIIQ